MTAHHPRLVGLTGRKRSGKDTVAGFLSRPENRISFAEPIKRILMDLNPYLDGQRSSGSFGDAREQGRLIDRLDASLPRWTNVRSILPPRTVLDIPAMLDELDPFVRNTAPDGKAIKGMGSRLSRFVTRLPDFDRYKDESRPIDREIRRLQQVLGTEIGRTMIARDLWVSTGMHNVHRIMQRAEDHDRVVITDCRFDDEAQAIRQAGGVVLRVIRPSLPPPDDSHASEAGVSDDLVDLEVINDGSLEDLEAAVRIVLPQTQSSP